MARKYTKHGFIIYGFSSCGKLEEQGWRLMGVTKKGILTFDEPIPPKVFLTKSSARDTIIKTERYCTLHNKLFNLKSFVIKPVILEK